ncbi:VOC family protein [Actinokineospora pegani]|uniref:VOC family protein n=1 Tax=Actinokineospora pegani TaxID=2654637 RepID=UPI0012EAEF3D|nr:VOC family protein [Actinokineospora pegani]
MTDLAHIAINADDVPTTRRFYADTFGWDFAPWGPPGFYRIDAGAPGGPGVAAALQQRRALQPDRPTNGFECTIAVEDVAATREAALAAGGRVLVEPVTIAGVGHLIWLADPSGNVVGAMTFDPAAD